MKLINQSIVLLAMISIIYLATTMNDLNIVTVFLLVSIGSLMILFISDCVLPRYNLKILLNVWRVICSTFAVALILSVYIAIGDNCNYACAYPILYVSMANVILAGVTLLFLIYKLVKNKQNEIA